MHNVATWLELAARARSAADAMGDPSEKAEMLDIAAGYEQRAYEAASLLEPIRHFGLYLSRMR